MPPLLTIDVDTAPLERALRDLPEALQRRVNDASEQTAHAIVAEMKARLARALKGTSVSTKSRPDKGQNLTLQGITTKPAYDGNGWVVLSDRDPFPNDPLWIEKGTRVGRRHNFARTAAEPYFYVSIELEMGGHERRLEQAMHDAAAETGLGD